jgi:hypothetical protein
LVRTSMQPEIARCVYCFNSPGVTKDHVPPKSFFPRPRPADLITVPCCQKCNQGSEKDEELFLATFMFSDAGSTPTGKRLWDEKLDRMYQKNLGLKKTVARMLSHKQAYTPAGLYLGRRMTISVDHPRLERVVEKIVRGLYYYEYGDLMPANVKVMTLFLNTDVMLRAAQQHFRELTAGKRMWSGIFEYCHNRVRESPEQSMWHIRFYACINFWIITGDDTTEPIDAIRSRGRRKLRTAAELKR